MKFSGFPFLICTYNKSKFQGNLRRKGDMPWMTWHGITHKGVKMGQTRKLPWTWKFWKFIILPFRLSFMYPPTKKNINTLHALSPTPFVKHTEKFRICVFKIRFCLFNIFMLLIISRFFLDNQGYFKHSTLKHWKWSGVRVKRTAWIS